MTTMTQGKPQIRQEIPRGIDLLHDPRYNKGTAFSEAERDALGIRGLLPPRVFTPEQQERRILENYARKPNDLEKYILLMALQDRNETLFYRVLLNNITEMMPIVYTPTVGEACKLFGHIWRRPRGLYISLEDRGRVAELMGNWPAAKVSIIVVTDGERILGLGDLGTFGMGIPIGKLALYSACAGVPPAECLPVTLDVGTNNEELLSDPLYTGMLQRRVRGESYNELVEEFVNAVEEVFPGTLIQFEDFATQNAFGLLERYRNRVCCFNDDIQGTAAVAVAGFVGASRITGVELKDQTLLFYGAGAAATGIADLVVSHMVRSGMDRDEARNRCWFIDSKGLVVASRDDLATHKRRYAHDAEFITDLTDSIRMVEPTGLVGVSGQPQRFTREVIELMAELNERPIIFPLSNPTSKSECTAEQAYTWTNGRAIFASGSPFDPVTLEGVTHVPGQANNVYIFPGLGLGAIAVGATRITDEMFTAAATALADHAAATCLEEGCIFPPLTSIRDVSASIAGAVAEVAYEQDLATVPRPTDLASHIRATIYEPQYPDYSKVEG